MKKFISIILIAVIFVMCLFTNTIPAMAADIQTNSEEHATEDVCPSTEPTTETPFEQQPSTSQIVKNGFYLENGKTRYYKNGRLHKGFLKLGKKKYYFNSYGNMVTGSQKIKGSYYYFNKNGIMRTGFIKINSKKYYYSKKSGKKLFGFRKIGKYQYYLKKNSGAVKTGFLSRKIKGEKVKTYYDKKGHLKKGTFKVSNVEYKSSKKIGKIYSVRNLAKALCQRPQLPTGCEITAWTMMVNFAGKKISKITAANIMPKSSNPNKGFVGSPYSSGEGVLVVYPNGLKSITKKYLKNYENMSYCSIGKIKSKLLKKHLVLAWVTQLDGFSSHTITLTGYDRRGFFYNDPWTGRKHKITYRRFRILWSGNSYRAMSY